MISFDNVTKESSKKHNQSWPQILDHSHRIEYLETQYPQNQIHHLI